MKTVKIKNQVYSTEIATDIYYPSNFDQKKKYVAIITAHPIGSSKEQTSGNVYGKGFAEAGFIAIAFNASFQGDSSGEPRWLEDPGPRVEDFRCVVDYLMTVNYIDENRIGCLGMCGGGGYAVKATMTDRRIKALGTVVGINFGRMVREGFGTGTSPVKALEGICAQRTAEAKGESLHISNSLPESPAKVEELGISEIDVIEATKYYKTERGEKPQAATSSLDSHMAALYGFDAFFPAEHLLTQPLQIIIGGVAGGFGSYRDGFDLLNRAKSEKKNIFVIEEASHYDLYWDPQYTSQAIDKLVSFYNENL
nr:alpha/beta hydrolase [uncultured Chryseobacterium sp.]